MVTFKRLIDNDSIKQLKTIDTTDKNLINRFIESIEEQADYSSVIGIVFSGMLCGAIMLSDLDYYDFGGTIYADSYSCANYKLDGIVLDNSKNTLPNKVKLLNYAVKNKLSRDKNYIGNKQVYLFADESIIPSDLLKKASFSQVKLPEETLYVRKLA